MQVHFFIQFYLLRKSSKNRVYFSLNTHTYTNTHQKMMKISLVSSSSAKIQIKENSKQMISSMLYNSFLKVFFERQRKCMCERGGAERNAKRENPK